MTLYRAILRDLMVAALKAAKTIAGDNVHSPGDWPTATDDLPVILVDDMHERKESEARAQPNFTTTASIVVDARIQGKDEREARILKDTICDQIEQAVLTNYDIIKAVQQISFVETTVKVNSDNGTHVAQVMMVFGLEFFQSQEDYYAPVNPPTLKTVALHADLKNVYDPNGTYTGSLFPDEVTPAPRTQGPDGRDEGLIIVNNLDQ